GAAPGLRLGTRPRPGHGRAGQFPASLVRQQAQGLPRLRHGRLSTPAMALSLPVSWWLLAPLATAAAGVFGLVLLGQVRLPYSLRSLVVRWKATAVTALAFPLLLTPLTVMLGFVNGMNRVIAGSGRPGNVLILSDGATDEVFGYLAPTEIDHVPLKSELQ